MAEKQSRERDTDKDWRFRLPATPILLKARGLLRVSAPQPDLTADLVLRRGPASRVSAVSTGENESGASAVSARS